MQFYNHCNKELSNEAIRVIAQKNWHRNYKNQIWLEAIDKLEVGNWVETSNGGYSTPFKVSDVKNIVEIVADFN